MTEEKIRRIHGIRLPCKECGGLEDVYHVTRTYWRPDEQGIAREIVDREVVSECEIRERNKNKEARLLYEYYNRTSE